MKKTEINKAWKEGCMKVGESIFHFWVKQYDTGSEYGIEGGRISKLMLRRNNEIVCNYDRGWVTKPVDDETDTALAIMMYEYNG